MEVGVSSKLKMVPKPLVSLLKLTTQCNSKTAVKKQKNNRRVPTKRTQSREMQTALALSVSQGPVLTNLSGFLFKSFWGHTHGILDPLCVGGLMGGLSIGTKSMSVTVAGDSVGCWVASGSFGPFWGRKNNRQDVDTQQRNDVHVEHQIPNEDKKAVQRRNMISHSQ
jgi:hypothetical protein